MRLGIVAALWAALVGAFLAARYRRQVADQGRTRPPNDRSATSSSWNARSPPAASTSSRSPPRPSARPTRRSRDDIARPASGAVRAYARRSRACSAASSSSSGTRCAPSRPGCARWPDERSAQTAAPGQTEGRERHPGDRPGGADRPDRARPRGPPEAAPRTAPRAAAAPPGTEGRRLPPAVGAAPPGEPGPHRLADTRTGEAREADRSRSSSPPRHGSSRSGRRGSWSTRPRCPTAGSCTDGLGDGAPAAATPAPRRQESQRRPEQPRRPEPQRPADPPPPRRAVPGWDDSEPEWGPSWEARRDEPAAHAFEPDMPFGSKAEQTSWLAQYNQPQSSAEPTYTSRAYVPQVRPEPQARAGPGADRPAEQAQRRVPGGEPPAGRRHRAEAVEESGGGGRRRRAEGQPSWQETVGRPEEPSGSHAAGRSVSELLANHGARLEPPPQAPSRGLTAGRPSCPQRVELSTDTSTGLFLPADTGVWDLRGAPGTGWGPGQSIGPCECGFAASGHCSFPLVGHVVSRRATRHR